MPYYPNGTWYAWVNQSGLGQITNSSDPFSTLIHSVSAALPWLFPVILGAFYVFLWVQFGDSPSRFKLASITALVFVVSFFMAAAGFVNNAVLNFVVFGIAFFVSFLFRM